MFFVAATDYPNLDTEEEQFIQPTGLGVSSYPASFKELVVENAMSDGVTAGGYMVDAVMQVRPWQVAP